jgi:hypothetical protein
MVAEQGLLHVVKGNATEISTHADAFLPVVETLLELSPPDAKNEQIGFPLLKTSQAGWRHWRPMAA